jgi:rubrerythrin
MQNATQEIMDGLKKAIQAERTGHEFYKATAAATKDQQGKKVFEQLAQEEAEHFRFLRAQYESFRTAGKLDKSLKLGKPGELDQAHPIFGAGFKDCLKQAHFEMSALAVAVQLELNGINHYRAEAERVSDPDVKFFYKALVAWESVHYEAFLKEQQALQEQYWEEAGFAPF